MSQSPHITDEQERTLELDFVRATENAALNSLPWLGRGDKNAADAAACDAIHGIFDLMECCGTVVIGEGIKDNAPGIFMGSKFGNWTQGSPHFDIAIDPIDGTTNIANGMSNAISVIAASAAEDGNKHSIHHLQSFYAQKLAWGPKVSLAIQRGEVSIGLDDPVEQTLRAMASALGKPVQQLVICLLNRPRHQELVAQIRQSGAALRLITDGDITAALAPSMPDSGIDLYMGIGGSTEAVLTAAALKTLGGEMHTRMWPHNDAERMELLAACGDEELRRIYTSNDLVSGTSALFCATGISDSPLLPGIKTEGSRVITSSILLRAHSRTIRYMRTSHDLSHKNVPLRSKSTTPNPHTTT
jgi:fructose-1,6-bisphosphatase II